MNTKRDDEKRPPAPKAGSKPEKAGRAVPGTKGQTEPDKARTPERKAQERG